MLGTGQLVAGPTIHPKRRRWQDAAPSAASTRLRQQQQLLQQQQRLVSPASGKSGEDDDDEVDENGNKKSKRGGIFTFSASENRRRNEPLLLVCCARSTSGEPLTQTFVALPHDPLPDLFAASTLPLPSVVATSGVRRRVSVGARRAAASDAVDASALPADEGEGTEMRTATATQPKRRRRADASAAVADYSDADEEECDEEEAAHNGDADVLDAGAVSSPVGIAGTDGNNTGISTISSSCACEMSGDEDIYKFIVGPHYLLGERRFYYFPVVLAALDVLFCILGCFGVEPILLRSAALPAPEFFAITAYVVIADVVAVAACARPSLIKTTASLVLLIPKLFFVLLDASTFFAIGVWLTIPVLVLVATARSGISWHIVDVPISPDDDEDEDT